MSKSADPCLSMSLRISEGVSRHSANRYSGELRASKQRSRRDISEALSTQMIVLIFIVPDNEAATRPRLGRRAKELAQKMLSAGPTPCDQLSLKPKMIVPKVN